MTTTKADVHALDGVRILWAGLGSIDDTLAQARRILAMAEHSGNAHKIAEYRWLIRELEALKAQPQAQGEAA